MNDENDTFREALKRAQHEADGTVTSFAVTFGIAKRKSQVRLRTRFAGLAAAAAIAVLGLSLLPMQEKEFTYVDLEELAATTRWSAPSDSLFPQHEVDVYRDLPRLPEWNGTTTDAPINTDEGAML
jgi:hypothetical protein